MTGRIRRMLLGIACLTALAAQPSLGEDAIYYELTERGNVMDWLVSPMHKVPYDYIGAALNFTDFDNAGGDGALQPLAGMKAGLGLPWEERHYEEKGWPKGVVTFKPQSYTLTYAFVYLYVEEEIRDVTLFTGSDDGLLVYWNGVEVQRVQVQRGYAPDQEKVTVVLNKGWNRLLCKIDDIAGGHGLFVRLVGADGQPLKGVKVCVSAPSDPSAKLNFVDGKAYEHDAMAGVAEAGRLASEGQIPAASARYEAVVTGYPKSGAAAESLYRQAGLQAKSGTRSQAIATLDRALKAYPYSNWVPDILIAKADALLTDKQLDDAAGTLLSVVEGYPESALRPEAMLRLADTLGLAAKQEDARNMLEQVRTAYPATVEAVRATDRLGDLAKDQKDLPAAKVLWQQAIDQSQELIEKKYVWFVNVQATLRGIAAGARTKIESVSQ